MMNSWVLRYKAAIRASVEAAVGAAKVLGLVASGPLSVSLPSSNEAATAVVTVMAAATTNETTSGDASISLSRVINSTITATSYHHQAPPAATLASYEAVDYVADKMNTDARMDSMMAQFLIVLLSFVLGAVSSYCCMKIIFRQKNSTDQDVLSQPDMEENSEASTVVLTEDAPPGGLSPPKASKSDPPVSDSVPAAPQEEARPNGNDVLEAPLNKSFQEDGSSKEATAPVPCVEQDPFALADNSAPASTQEKEKDTVAAKPPTEEEEGVEKAEKPTTKPSCSANIEEVHKESAAEFVETVEPPSPPLRSDLAAVGGDEQKDAAKPFSASGAATANDKKGKVAAKPFSSNETEESKESAAKPTETAKPPSSTAVIPSASCPKSIFAAVNGKEEKVTASPVSVANGAAANSKNQAKIMERSLLLDEVGDEKKQAANSIGAVKPISFASVIDSTPRRRFDSIAANGKKQQTIAPLMIIPEKEKGSHQSATIQKTVLGSPLEEASCRSGGVRKEKAEARNKVQATRRQEAAIAMVQLETKGVKHSQASPKAGRKETGEDILSSEDGVAEMLTPAPENNEKRAETTTPRMAGELSKTARNGNEDTARTPLRKIQRSITSYCSARRKLSVTIDHCKSLKARMVGAKRKAERDQDEGSPKKVAKTKLTASPGSRKDGEQSKQAAVSKKKARAAPEEVPVAESPAVAPSPQRNTREELEASEGKPPTNSARREGKNNFDEKKDLHFMTPKEKVETFVRWKADKDANGPYTQAAKDFFKKSVNPVVRCLTNHFNGDVDAFLSKYPMLAHTKFGEKCCKGWEDNRCPASTSPGGGATTTTPVGRITPKRLSIDHDEGYCPDPLAEHVRPKRFQKDEEDQVQSSLALTDGYTLDNITKGRAAFLCSHCDWCRYFKSSEKHFHDFNFLEYKGRYVVDFSVGTRLEGAKQECVSFNKWRRHMRTHSKDKEGSNSSSFLPALYTANPMDQRKSTGGYGKSPPLFSVDDDSNGRAAHNPPIPATEPSSGQALAPAGRSPSILAAKRTKKGQVQGHGFHPGPEASRVVPPLLPKGKEEQSMVAGDKKNLKDLDKGMSCFACAYCDWCTYFGTSDTHFGNFKFLEHHGNYVVDFQDTNAAKHVKVEDCSPFQAWRKHTKQHVKNKHKRNICVGSVNTETSAPPPLFVASRKGKSGSQGGERPKKILKINE